MSSRDYFKLGDFNAICDICGNKFKGSELQKRWDGFMVCHDDWEPRPQQEFIRGIKENFATPYSRPDSTEGQERTYAGAIPGYAIAGEAIPGYAILPAIEKIIGTFSI
jgi:hypothetical protein